MGRMLVLLGIVFAVGCAEPVSTDVAVGPQAAQKWELIESAVDAMNDEVGEDVFTVGPATGNGPVEGHITVELVQALRGRVAGETNRRNVLGEISITIDMDTNVVQMAHELGHAAGLEHVDDPHNVMYVKATELHLNAEQRAHLIGMM